jgi:hypothetical protein
MKAFTNPTEVFLKTSYLILTLFTIFVTSAPAKDVNYIQMSILDNDCVFVDMDIDFGSIPAAEQPNYSSYLSFCDGMGAYKILKDGLEDKFKLSLDFNNEEIELSDEVVTYSQNVAWVFSNKMSVTGVPVALVYSKYTDVLIDSKNNVWEPKETQVVVALKGTKSCIVAEINEDKNSEINWEQTMRIAEKASDFDCINK